MVNATLYLFQYNNYYNRIVKKEETIQDYIALTTGDNPTAELLYTLEKVNFIPEDYVDTAQILNYEGKDPDYCIVVDEAGNINSRWFIISSHRVRGGQVEVSLRRDLVVDYYDDFINTDCFVEKGVPTSLRDPAIFNSEDMGFNQIKKEEILLKDKSNCS